MRRGAEDAARPNFGEGRSPKPPSVEIILPRGDDLGSCPPNAELVASGQPGSISRISLRALAPRPPLLSPLPFLPLLSCPPLPPALMPKACGRARTARVIGPEWYPQHPGLYSGSQHHIPVVSKEQPAFPAGHGAYEAPFLLRPFQSR